jgi:hypothetical protein
MKEFVPYHPGKIVDGHTQAAGKVEQVALSPVLFLRHHYVYGDHHECILSIGHEPAWKLQYCSSLMKTLNADAGRSVLADLCAFLERAAAWFL